MNLKTIFLLLCFTLVLIRGSNAQTTYSFTTNTDTAFESATNSLIGYVRADVAPTVADTVLIFLKSGKPIKTHIDTSGSFTLIFNPGVDSVGFYIQLHDDTFPEYAEHLSYVLRYNGVNNSLIGTDSLLAFTLLDNDLPATISFISDSGWTWEDRDTFINGVYDPDNSPFYVGMQINNPNPFFIRYIVDNLDCYHTGGQPNINCCAGTDFYYNGDTVYAPPGMSTYYKTGNSVTQSFVHPDFHFYCVIRNVDANIIPDSLMFFTIKTDDFYDPPSVSFDTPGQSVMGDTTMLIGIPITIHNNNRVPLYYRVDTFNLRSNLPGPDFTIGNPYFGYGNGTTFDTLWLTLLNRHLINDTINADFVIRGVAGNLSPDTLYHLTIIDTGTLIVSFKGAGFAHLKDDSIGYVEVYTNSPVTYPVTVYVSYLNGDAVAGVDYLWRDTTVVFPPYLFDTIALPVIMLKNHIHDGNKQVNFQLSNASPSFVQFDIRQYTYTIIDNDSTANYPAGVTYLNENLISIYPNPFSTDFNIHTSAMDYKISITDLLGAELYTAEKLSGDVQINLSALPSGAYLIRISSGGNSCVKMMTKI